jgi:hypothetical protein
MANVKTIETAPVETPAASTASSFWKRELNGATFLSLEHVCHMVLVVVVAVLLSAGVVTAISLWSGNSGVLSALGTMPTIGGPAARWTEANASIGLVAALATLVPLMTILDRRTRAEWAKRPGYESRVAYKVPVYVALGVLVAGKVFALIQMLTVVLTSLAVIGVKGYDIGSMYLYQFLPAAIAALIFGAAGWYLFKLAKGRDNGRAYSVATSLVAMMVAVALFVTAVIVLHTPGSTIEPSGGTNYFDDFNSGDSRSLEDLFRY